MISISLVLTWRCRFVFRFARGGHKMEWVKGKGAGIVALLMVVMAMMVVERSAVQAPEPEMEKEMEDSELEEFRFTYQTGSRHRGRVESFGPNSTVYMLALCIQRALICVVLTVCTCDACMYVCMYVCT